MTANSHNLTVLSRRKSGGTGAYAMGPWVSYTMEVHAYAYSIVIWSTFDLTND